MAHRYAPVPNPGPDRRATQHDREVEMQAAFDYSDDEDDDHNASESQPLNPAPTSAATSIHAPPPRAPGLYNFETVDYDYPPPGSPPPPSATALPNDIGNSNGLVPSFSPSQTPGPHRMWFQRAAAVVLPPSVLSRVGLTPRRPSGPIGGGTNNDGVFANVTAKPTAPVRVQDGDDTYLVPEEARQEAPPSYASAQADAVPPYWETTVHAPFSPDSMGEMVIDSLPTGSLFSFCWNLLVSVSFQFVGFLLTYLLHTSHAARLGSRAGLGITLIQYGFALRSRLDSTDDNDMSSGWGDPTDPNAPPTMDGHHGHHHASMSNVSWASPVSNMTEEQANVLVADATTEWLSFFLMTVGWFVLLTSLLGFWRVKRWERGILASQRDSNTPAPTSRPNPNLISQLESTFGLRGTSRADLFRQGFGFGPRHNADDEVLRAHALAERGEADQDATETEPMIPVDPNDPERARLIAAVLANERRLQQDLRAAGLI